ncbi:hypothetical protein KSS87_004953, partial [Heliosperma pusillum]
MDGDIPASDDIQTIDKRLSCGASSNSGGGSSSDSSDFDSVRRAMCKMVITDGLSLRTSERVGFKNFVANLNPHFTPSKPIDLVKDAVNYHNEEKKIVRDELQRAPGRICFTIDNMRDD